jgi:hypothetical protein
MGQVVLPGEMDNRQTAAMAPKKGYYPGRADQ